MILQMAAHGRMVGQHRNAVLLEQCRGPDAG